MYVKTLGCLGSSAPRCSAMHEMGIAMEILSIASASIPETLKGAKVHSIRLKIGKLTALVPESLRFCFDIVSQDTPLAGARLLIEEIPLVMRCDQCHNEWTLEGPSFSCPACESGRLTLLSGRDLDIESIEIEEEDNCSRMEGKA